MVQEGSSRYARAALRRSVPGDVFIDVVLCRGDSCRAQVVDEQGGSLGLVLRGEDAERALEHRACCSRKPVRLRVDGPEDGESGEHRRDVPAELIHVTALGDGVKAGVGFLVSCLDAHDVQHLLALWDRFRDPTAG